MIQTVAFSKKMFFASIGLLIYFSLVFTGLIAKLDNAVIGAIYEFITIPLIASVIAIFAIAAFLFVIRKKTNFYNIASCIVTIAIIVAMFLVK
ncbi:hypothetical protein [Pedobacter sp.]|uniref:hypothetical protein n=1 Tax=Pedobacter sp. TaxID=1411316 RepID=UPI0031CFB9E5